MDYHTSTPTLQLPVRRLSLDFLLNSLCNRLVQRLHSDAFARMQTSNVFDPDSAGKHSLHQITKTQIAELRSHSPWERLPHGVDH